ncbi:MAG TPA: hypothetical protein VJ203_11220, partial [Bacteroidales bacterium]|nr:hypothetical protein [Bacteroidales bacterium]
CISGTPTLKGLNIILNSFVLANNHDYIRTYTNSKSVMSSYRQILYHVILRTKDSKKTLTQTHIKIDERFFP